MRAKLPCQHKTQHTDTPPHTFSEQQPRFMCARLKTMKRTPGKAEVICAVSRGKDDGNDDGNDDGRNYSIITFETVEQTRAGV